VDWTVAALRPFIAGVSHTEMKRKLLTYIVLIQLAVGLFFVAVPFSASLQPPEYKRNQEYRAYNTPKTVNITSLESGQLITVAWQGLPIGIYRRTPEEIDFLTTNEKLSIDPRSRFQNEPPDWWGKASIDLKAKYLATTIRSQNPEYFVFTQVSPVFGCMLEYLPPNHAEKYSLPISWPGGFVDPCTKVKFDLAGKVFIYQGFTSNLLVPPHEINGNKTITLKPKG